MRIFKKFIKKLYHLIWFLSIFLFFIPIVNAEPSISNYTVNSNYLQPNSYIGGTSSANKLRFDVQSDGSITYIRNIFCFDSRVISWYGNLPTNQLYDVIFYDTNQKCNFYGSNYDGGHVMYFYATYEPINNPSASFEITFDTSSNFSIGLINYTVSHTPYQYIFSQPDESTQINIDTNGIINSQNQSSQNIINNQDSNTQSIIESSGSNTQSIIDSSGSNTQSIIDSSGSNTQSIIDNNNQNTQQEIESQKVCKITNIDKNDIEIDNKYLANNGVLVYSDILGVTSYIKLNSFSTLTITKANSATSCFYNENKILISCFQTSSTGTVSIPQNAKYFRATIQKSNNTPTFSLKYCTNGNQALDDSINGLNDTLNDSSIDSSDDTINNLKNKIPTNSVISDLLLLPVRFLQNFVNALGSSCSTFSLGSLYGTELFMPCINIENYLGSGIWTTIDLIISGMFVYALRKKFIQIYENMTDLKNGGNEID